MNAGAIRPTLYHPPHKQEKMSRPIAQWHFATAHPGERARESQVDKFFSSDALVDRGNAVVREGTQNTLDAATTAEVEVRIRIGQWSQRELSERRPRYFIGLDEHVDAVGGKLSEVPARDTPFRFLTFEDFGTAGLRGDPTQWWIDDSGESNPFFNFFRAEGISDKDHGRRGRHGVGKSVFERASRVRAMFGLTRRADDREMLMGTCVLRSHRIASTPYVPDGWYGVQSDTESSLVMPVETDVTLLSNFRSDFGITRRRECGLSIVVPWLSEEVTPDTITEAAIRGYFDPILRRKIRFRISTDAAEDIIDSETLLDRIGRCRPDFVAEVLPFIHLSQASIADGPHVTIPVQTEAGAPKWEKVSISSAALETVASRLDEHKSVVVRADMKVLRKSGDPVDDSFTLVLKRDLDARDGGILFVREGITITDVRPKRTPAIRALVIVDEGPLAKLLGDSENPSHTQWQKDAIKDKYKYAPAHIEYVVESIPWLLRKLSAEQRQADPSLLIDLFSLPEVSSPQPRTPEPAPRPNPRPGPITVKPGTLPPPRPKPFQVHKVAGGFAVSRRVAAVPRPSSISVSVAYDVRRGNPLSKYDVADFRLGTAGVEVSMQGARIADLSNNTFRIVPEREDFEVSVTGFDQNRDIHVATRATYRTEDEGDAA